MGIARALVLSSQARSAVCPLSGSAARAPESSASRRVARGPATRAAARLFAECADMYRLGALVWIEVSAPRCACAHDRFCLILFASLTSQPEPLPGYSWRGL